MCSIESRSPARIGSSSSLSGLASAGTPMSKKVSSPLAAVQLHQRPTLPVSWSFVAATVEQRASPASAEEDVDHATCGNDVACRRSQCYIVVARPQGPALTVSTSAIEVGARGKRGRRRHPVCTVAPSAWRGHRTVFALESCSSPIPATALSIRMACHPVSPLAVRVEADLDPRAVMPTSRGPRLDHQARCVPFELAHGHLSSRRVHEAQPGASSGGTGDLRHA